MGSMMPCFCSFPFYPPRFWAGLGAASSHEHGQRKWLLTCWMAVGGRASTNQVLTEIDVKGLSSEATVEVLDAGATDYNTFIIIVDNNVEVLDAGATNYNNVNNTVSINVRGAGRRRHRLLLKECVQHCGIVRQRVRRDCPAGSACTALSTASCVWGHDGLWCTRSARLCQCTVAVLSGVHYSLFGSGMYSHVFCVSCTSLSFMVHVPSLSFLCTYDSV